MEAGGTLTTAAGDLGKQINSCSEQVSGIGTWEGPSHDSITEQVESFVGEYTTISSQLTALGEACDEYIKYAELYRQMKATEQDMMNAAKEDDKERYRSDIANMKVDLETLKGNISGALSDASSPSLEASALSPSISFSAIDDLNFNFSYVGGGNTQASEFYTLGDKAYNAYQVDDPAIQEWIEKVGKIVQNTNTYGMKKSLIIAQIINESGWMSTHASSLSDFNNVLGVNTDMGSIKPDMQDSAWSKKRTSGYNNVTQWNSEGTKVIGTYEDMRHYDSIEECIEDYSNILYLCHPELKGNNDIYAYSDFLSHYTPNPESPVVNKYAKMIEDYNLDRFDV